jgi:hypothetical protein
MVEGLKISSTQNKKCAASIFPEPSAWEKIPSKVDGRLAEVL